MRLHLIIVRHGLPATRILWTTTASTYGSHVPAPASAIASSRTPNIAFSNGGYTIAQLLEDVNEVVPLETEPSVFDPEFSSRWGLEDYVVEVGGSECLHFMELEGILRDGDEVVIRALQIADMRARRLCGRHQITADGKHLIDGVPFGLPFKQRNTSNRPAIAIPPRKKRRTMLSSWDQDPGYTFDDQNGDEDGDGDWLPAGETGLGKELSILPAEHDMSLGTVIRHPVDHSADEDSEDADGYEIAEDELESELKALKEDFEEVTSHHMDIQSQVEQIPEPSSRRPTSAGNRPGSSGSLHRGSVVGASSLSSKRSRGDDSSPRVSKAVRFNRGEDLPEQPRPIQGAKSQPGDISLDMPDADSASDSDFDSAEDSDVSSSEGSELSEAESSSSSEEGDSSSDESSDSEDSSSSDNSSSEEDSSSDEAPTPKKPRHSMAPPGQGSVRTKKSNNRFKLRRRLSKLKELGVLPDDADFAALRSWEEKNGGFHFIDDSSIMTTPISKSEKKEQEQRDFEARRQKLLDDLARGGVDVEEASEKENVPPRPPTVSEPAPKPAAPEESTNENPEAERPNRRALDIASTRRLLFGSLGVRTPKTKADEEATRKKLAAQFKTHTKRPKEEEAPVKEDDAQADPNWQKKLIIKATECIFPDIKLTAPPYPFVNRWDSEADAIIRERLGWNKKRKRKQRIQVYENDYEEYQDEAYGEWDDTQLNYDEQNYDQEHYDQEAEQVAVVDDLPALPEDPNSLPDLLEAEVKPGAIIAFRQLDMSKDTNWQPLMSEFRVAEVREVDDGTIHVELAVRDRKVKREDPDPDNDEPREYAGFEMPGFDDDEEDDGLRELVFAELSDPKLLTPAPPQDNELQNKEKENDENVVQEDSIVSVIEDSMPNAQLAPPTDMDLDETTFVTLVTANESPDRTSDITSIRVSGRSVPTIQGLDADDEQSDSLMVPSPSFSGFHSAQSSPGNRLFNNVGEESNILDGHTLIEENHTTLADISNQDITFLSANEQSASNTHTQSQEQHDRQVVEELQVPAGANGSGNDSLLSIVHAEADANSFASKTSPARSLVEESPDVRRDYAGEASDDWEEIAEALGNSSSPHDNTDQDKDKSMNNTDDEDKDSLLHSNQSLDLSPHPSPPPSSSLSSRKPPPSAQRDSSQPTPKAKKSKVSSKRKTDPTASPNATSTRSKPSGRATDSQIPLPRALDFIDLTQSSAPNTPGVHSPTADDDSQPPIKSSQSSASKVQRMTEVSITPKSQKKSKRRSSRKL